MMMINKSPVVGPMEGAPFLFRKRVEKIDWRRLGRYDWFCFNLSQNMLFMKAAVDVNRVASQRDIDTLQEILTSVVFCDITSEIVSDFSQCCKQFPVPVISLINLFISGIINLE